LEKESDLRLSRVLFHSLLFLITAVCTTLTGAGFWVGTQLQSASLISPIEYAVTATLRGNFEPLTNGLVFSFTLLTILGAHEFGHYFACRYYGVRATLPFFIPAPPLLTPFGTFGAVIKIRDQIRSRKALFDIGIAGPLAGFVFALPASFIGLWIAKPSTINVTGGDSILFQDPPLFQILNQLLGVPAFINWNPVYWAAWAALLVTALNLFPVGQLDGGHVVFAVAGRRIHKWVSLFTAVGVGVLAVLSFVWHQSPIWFLWTLVLLFLLKVGHPPVIETESLGPGRVILAVIALVVFLLCFLPFPITIT
jgi:membrane-associated protease RseP (regulator of RpoE activity)